MRKETERREREYLSPFAMLSVDTQGRKEFEKPCSLRTEFQKDRDRILHSKAFRRLKHKTQVYIDPLKDHYRTRMTHTLEVSQIARTIARALSLNEDLTEAISLGHDLGHTPFGHMGEDILNRLNPNGFKHYIHSVKIVEFLESKEYRQGLNLTLEVIDGIKNHTGDNYGITLEAHVMKYADRIAYINHDIDDSIRAGILTENDLPKDIIEVLGHSHSERISTMIYDIVSNSKNKNKICMSNEVKEASESLRNFLFKNIYLSETVKSEEAQAEFLLETLYNYYLKDIDRLPLEYRYLYKNFNNISKEEMITDYIAGMTDRYAINEFKRVILPRGWRY